MPPKLTWINTTIVYPQKRPFDAHCHTLDQPEQTNNDDAWKLPGPGEALHRTLRGELDQNRNKTLMQLRKRCGTKPNHSGPVV